MTFKQSWIVVIIVVTAMHVAGLAPVAYSEPTVFKCATIYPEGTKALQSVRE